MTTEPQTPPETRARKYTVLAGTAPVESLLEIRRSEFIGHAVRVESEAQARAFVDSLRRTHHGARHVCSAFVLGADREVQRSSDDGEPAGTAGIPMLQALLSHRTDPQDESVTDLSDVCTAVVRYFGGIKLGAGGLVRAYTDAVVQTLDRTTLVPRTRRRLARIEVPHVRAGRLENELRAAGLALRDTEYGPDHAVLHLSVPDERTALERAEARLAALSQDTLALHWDGSDWLDG